MTVMTRDVLGDLRAADAAWHVATAEASAAAGWRRDAVRSARAAGYSQKEIAEVLQVSAMSVSRLERDANVRGGGRAES